MILSLFQCVLTRVILFSDYEQEQIDLICNHCSFWFTLFNTNWPKFPRKSRLCASFYFTLHLLLLKFYNKYTFVFISACFILNKNSTLLKILSNNLWNKLKTILNKNCDSFGEILAQSCGNCFIGCNNFNYFFLFEPDEGTVCSGFLKYYDSIGSDPFQKIRAFASYQSKIRSSILPHSARGIGNWLVP